ncbi:MAG: hypothetical protein AAFW89_05950 [Bacteroidota bacterium]
MEINKLSSQVSNQIDSAKAAEGGNAASKADAVRTSDTNSADKVSLSGAAGNAKTDEQFAKIELDKLNQSSFDKLRSYKAKMQEFEAAKKVSSEAAAQTEIGKMLNDPKVWEKIAEGIQGK